MGFLGWFASMFGKRRPRKVLVISDVHGNAHALDAVIKEAKQDGVTDVFFLGDLFGIGAYPNETVKLLRDLEHQVKRNNGDFVMISGNCDFFALSDSGRDFLRKDRRPQYKEQNKLIFWSVDQLTPENKHWARSHMRLGSKEEIIKAAFLMADPKKDLVWDPKMKQYHIKWTSKHLSAQDRQLLQNMGFQENPEKAIEKLSAVFGGEPLKFDAEISIGRKPVHLVHGGPGPLFGKRVNSDFTAEQAFKLLRDDVKEIIAGHRHVDEDTRTKDGKRFISVGSVGNPRTGKPGAAYAIIRGRDQNGELRVEHKIAKYDTEAAAREIHGLDWMHPNGRNAIADAVIRGVAADEPEMPRQIRKSWFRRLFSG